MKKLLSFVLAIVLVLSVFTVGAFADATPPADYVPVDASDTTRYQAASKWDGTVYTITTIENKYTFDGEGTEASPYLIKSADDLAKLAANVRFTSTDTNYAGKYFKLTVDIDMQHNAWMGIGGCFNGVRWGAASADSADRDFEMFQGIFDGDNHVIYNFNLADKNANNEAICANGLFGYAGKGAAIYNLGIANGEVSLVNASRFAGLIGASRFDLEVKNCFNRANFIFSYTEGFTYAGPGGGVEVRVGGLMGAVMNDGSTVRTIENCYNSGNITVNLPNGFSKYCVAGIVGYISDCVASDFINCVNTGTITVNANHGAVASNEMYQAAIASLVGTIAWNNSYCVFKDCQAGGTIVYNNPNADATGYGIGAFLGYVRLISDVDFDGRNVYSVVLNPDEPIASNPGAATGNVTKVDSITLTFAEDGYFMADVPTTNPGDTTTPGGDNQQGSSNDDNTQTQASETNAPETNAPETNATTTTAPVGEEGGCASVVASGMLIALLTVGGATLCVKKKKED